MVEYIATNNDGFTLFIGDDVFGPNGAVGKFEGVAGHDPEGGGMMIMVSGQRDYAAYWGVWAEEIDDEPDFDEWGDFEDEYSGYYVEDEYYADLYGEPYEQDDVY